MSWLQKWVELVLNIQKSKEQVICKIVKLLFILIFISIIYSEVPNKKYLWPTNKDKTITTLFGEKRSRRFHAGIDVRTYGEIGDKLFAVESGYISRISISPNGYGKALYLKL